MKLLVGALLASWLFSLALLIAYIRVRNVTPTEEATADTVAAPPLLTSVTQDREATHLSAHNLMLRKGPSFRVYVRWLNGDLSRTHRNQVPSFDNTDSFYLDIKTGVLRANIGDIGIFLNSVLTNSPLTDVTLRGDGDRITLTGKLHKVLTLPVVLEATIAALPDGRIRLHVASLKVLKVPVKGLLSVFRVNLSDFVPAGRVPGLEVNRDDLTLDTAQLLPPPHINGKLTLVHVVNPDLELVYGDATKDLERVEEWRNFLRLSGGSLDFGRLTMHPVDLTMIDISKDAWFDLDLANYQVQLIHGYTRMTPQAGLQIFMPDLRDLPPAEKPKQISLEWLKNRNEAPPPEITSHGAR